MKYLVISNKGEIENEAITLLGGSTKRNDNNKIGFFGSGNKYALAFFLKNGYETHIYSGVRKIELGLKEVTFRKKSFSKITIDERETDITTDFGPQWKLWHGFREIYANAIDEGNTTAAIHEETEIIPQEGITRFCISCNEELEKLYNNFDEYFSFRRTDMITRVKKEGWAENTFDCYPSLVENKSIIYRKGIRVIENLFNGLFDYDIDIIDINESRIAESYVINSILRDMYVICSDSHFLKQFLSKFNNNTKCFEWDFYWSGGGNSYNKAWVEALKGHTVIPEEAKELFIGEDNPIYLPSNMVQQLRIEYPNDINFPFGLTGKAPYKIVSHTDEEEQMVNTIKVRLVDVGYKDFPTWEKVQIKQSSIKGMYDVKHNLILIKLDNFNEQRQVDETFLFCYMQYVKEKQKIESDIDNKFEDFLLTEMLNKFL